VKTKKIKYGDNSDNFKSIVGKNSKISKYFFPYEVEIIEKQYPDMFLIMYRRGISKEKLLNGKFIQVNVYSKNVEEYPDELFFNKQINWHQQHFCRKGLIAAAGLYLPNDDSIFIELMQSDLMQQLFRNKKFREKYRTELENKYRYWYKILFNFILDFAVDKGFKRIYCPTSKQLSKKTKKKMDNSIFVRIYDHVDRKFDCNKKKIHKAEYWRVNVKENIDKLTRLKSKKRKIKKTDKIVCIYHDIEEDIDADVSKEKCKEYLKRMLEIEKKYGIKATYNILGQLFKEKEKIITNCGDHSVAFHSFNHDVRDLNQIKKSRDVDLQVRGYRPPQSKITEELTDYNLSYHNFEWMMSSASSFGFDKCRLEKGIVKIPVYTDDYSLSTGELNYEKWEKRLIRAVKKNDFVAFGTHDCYGEYWIDKYDGLLSKLKKIGVRFMNCDEITGKMFLDEVL